MRTNTKLDSKDISSASRVTAQQFLSFKVSHQSRITRSKRRIPYVSSSTQEGGWVWTSLPFHRDKLLLAVKNFPCAQVRQTPRWTDLSPPRTHSVSVKSHRLRKLPLLRLLLSFPVGLTLFFHRSQSISDFCCANTSVNNCRILDVSGFVILAGIILKLPLKHCHLLQVYRVGHRDIPLVFWCFLWNSHRAVLIREGNSSLNLRRIYS